MTDRTDARVLCPHCGSDKTELSALFGSQLLTVQYYCHACRTPFERVKDENVIADARRMVGRLTGRVDE